MEIADLLKWYLVFLYSTTLHEAAHSWTAWKLGDDTAYRGGQVSLDPIPHIRREPLGMVVVPLVSFFAAGWMIGWASAPYNPAWAMANPRRAGLMALAGPLANFGLVILSGIAIRAGIQMHYFQVPAYFSFMSMTQSVGGAGAAFAARTLSICFSLNLILGTFNLLPIPPLDGASVLLLFVSGSAAKSLFSLIRHPTLRLVGIYLAWQLFGHISRPIQLFAAHTLYPDLIF